MLSKSWGSIMRGYRQNLEHELAGMVIAVGFALLVGAGVIGVIIFILTGALK